MPAATGAKPEEGSTTFPKHFEEEIDVSTFDQILEMDDDDDDREFSKSIVYDFFAQAEDTFVKIDEELANEDLEALSHLGHYLKGSSATLGLMKVRDSCEKVQNLGARKDETGNEEQLDDKKSLKAIRENADKAKADLKVAEKLLRKFFGEEEEE